MKDFMKELLWRVEWLVWDPAVEFLMGHMWARVLAIAVVSALASVLTILLPRIFIEIAVDLIPTRTA